MTARRGIAFAGVALAAALVTGRVLAGAYAEWAWYGSLGAASLWNARMEALTTLRLGLFAIAFVFAFANLLVMRRSIVSLVLPRQLGNLVIGEAVAGSTLTGVAVLLSVAIAAAVALPQDDWLILLRAIWATPIGEIDPYLGRDMAFWLGWLPFERSMQAWSVLVAVVVGATVLALYGLTPSMRLDGGRVHISTRARRHFAVYTGILLLLVAWGYRLDAFDLLIHGTGVRETFVAFDHQVLYPYRIALSIGTASLALLVAWTGWKGQQRATLGLLLLLVMAGPVGSMLLPVLDRRSALERERSSMDRPYHHVRALYTRRAYRLEEVRRGAAADSVRAGAGLLGISISGWDPALMARALADESGVMAVQGTTSWRVTREGRLRVAALLGTASSDASRAPLAVKDSDPTDADDRGAPWPATDGATSAVPPLSVGLGLAPVLPVSDTGGRVAAPRFPPGWQRIALAWSVRKLGLAFIDANDRRVKLLMRRDVRERVQTILPFFAVGVTPQPLLAADSLWWVVELFNTSEDYPLTEPVLFDGAQQRFAAAAGVALVNAHSGRVSVILPRRADKVTRWWRDRLPELFVSPRVLDGGMLAALPPPVDRAVLQGTALSRVGFEDDTLSARPLFQVDDADVNQTSGANAPAPFVSGAALSPLAWGVPVVDATDQLRGVFVAVGGAQPGTAFVEAPERVTWSSIVDRLQRAADSTRMLRSSAHPRQGRVQVVPATDGLHVTQTFYDWPPEGAPRLVGVATWQAGIVRTGNTMAVAMGGPMHPVTADGSLRLRITRLYTDMREALRREDWTAFGRAMEALRRLASNRP